MDVVAGAVACFDGEVLRYRRLEASGFDGDGVVTHREDVEAVVAGAVGGGCALLIGAEVGNNDRSIGNDGTGGVGDRT